MSEPLTVGGLIPKVHAGRQAVIDGREGRLVWATIPVYPRLDVRCWYLAIPSQLAGFTEDALSLQWATSEPVTLLAEDDLKGAA